VEACRIVHRDPPIWKALQSTASNILLSRAKRPKRVVVLSSGPPISLKVLYCLHKLDIEADVIDLLRTSIAKYSRYRRQYAQFRLDGADDEGAQLSRQLGAYILQNGIDAVVGVDVFASGMLHAVRDRIPQVILFPLSSAATLEMLDDKWQFQQFMVENQIPCPRSILLRSVQELSSMKSLGLAFPVVVKPLRGESGHGIVHADSIAGIRRHLESGSMYARLPLLIQEFASGYDADLSILARAGTVASHVLHSRLGGCSLRFIKNDAVLDIGKRIARAANYTGVANIDVRIDETTGRVCVLECNPRFWYTLQASLWRGLNFVEAGLALAQGDSEPREAPVGGTYHLHGCLLKKILWNPANWRDVSLYNVKGLLQALTDPLPFIHDRLARRIPAPAAPN
jgi:biotin carboxylase